LLKLIRLSIFTFQIYNWFQNKTPEIIKIPLAQSQMIARVTVVSSNHRNIFHCKKTKITALIINIKQYLTILKSNFR